MSKWQKDAKLSRKLNGIGCVKKKMENCFLRAFRGVQSGYQFGLGSVFSVFGILVSKI